MKAPPLRHSEVRVVVSRPQQLAHPERVSGKGRSVKDGVEVQKRLGVAVGQESRQIDFVEAIQLVGSVTVIQPLQPTVGQNPPLHGTMLDVERNLVRRVGEGITTALHRAVELAMPSIGIADSKSDMFKHVVH